MREEIKRKIEEIIHRLSAIAYDGDADEGEKKRVVDKILEIIQSQIQQREETLVSIFMKKVMERATQLPISTPELHKFRDYLLTDLTKEIERTK